MKRDIFDNYHKNAINLGHKADVNEEDCLMSNLSGKRSEPQGSISSISCNLRKQKHLTVKTAQNKSNKSIQIKQKFDQDDFVISSPNQNNGTMNFGLKSDAKIAKFQTFVQQMEEQQEQNEKTKRAEVHRDIINLFKVQIYEIFEISQILFLLLIIFQITKNYSFIFHKINVF